MSKLTAALFALAIALPAVGGAQPLPAGVFPGERSLKDATTGAYALDADHAAVIAKVSHIGYSLSVFRFDAAQGNLAWNAANPSKSTLTVTVQTASINTPVKDFAKELAGAGYLKSAAFPTATFVSTAFHRIDATHGKVEGRFTLMGKSRPMTFNVTLVGAGKGFFNHPRIGVHAESGLNPADFGLSSVLGKSIALVIDAEFAKS
jgi:polyisoprenoid-binding protein YceI